MNYTVCDKCNRPLFAGDWPFCPHGQSARGSKAIADDWPGGKVFHNLGPVPVKLYSNTERKRVMKKLGLEEFVRHTPTPGSDKSPHTTSWATMDQHTLDQARILLERVGRVVPGFGSSDDQQIIEQSFRDGRVKEFNIVATLPTDE